MIICTGGSPAEAENGIPVKIRTPANKPAIIRFHIFVFNCFSPFGMCFDVFDLICPDVMCLDLMFDLFHDLNFRNVAKSPDILIQTFPSFFIFSLFYNFCETAVAFRAKCKIFSRHLQKPILKTEKGRFKGL